MSEYGELRLEPVLNGVHAVTGRYLKGHVPANKGRKWSEWMPKRSQKRAALGWKNLEKHRPKVRPQTAGRCKKAVVAILDDGRWSVFPYSQPAAVWCGGNRDNVTRCCRLNQRRMADRRTNQVNDDHRYMGVRFYFESDPCWTQKIAEG